MITSLDPQQAIASDTEVRIAIPFVTRKCLLYPAFTHGHFSIDRPIHYGVLYTPADQGENQGGQYCLVRDAWEQEEVDFLLGSRRLVIEELSTGDAGTTSQEEILHELHALKARLDEE